MRRFSASIIAVALVLVGCAVAPYRAQVEWAGTYSVRSIERVPDSGSLTGMRNAVSGTLPLRVSTDITAKLGTHFGVGFLLLGPRNGDKVNLRAVVTFPQGGLRNPDTGLSASSHEWIHSCTVGSRCTVGFYFRELWELQAGTWSVEVRSDTGPLVHEQFGVVVE